MTIDRFKVRTAMSNIFSKEVTIRNFMLSTDLLMKRYYPNCNLRLSNEEVTELKKLCAEYLKLLNSGHFININDFLESLGWQLQ